MKRVKIADGVEIGGDKTFIIADISSNHKQDLNLAKESIDAAIEAGADAVKFQSIKLEELYYKPDKTTSEFIKKLEFPEDWHYKLNEYCNDRNIIFFSSPTYLKAVDLLESINVPLYKLASAQIGTFPQIIEKVAALNKPTIFSTGIADYAEITEAVRIFKKHKNDKYIILHCNSIYPTPSNKVNLQLIKTYQSMFNAPIGFSDHTIGIHIACAAVTMGAKVIEKHFTLNRKLETPDCNDFASDPEELKLLVNNIRDIEKATNVFFERLEIQEQEQDFKQSITYKIFANRNMKKEHIIRKADLKFLRTKDEGINCKQEKSIIGKKLLHDVCCGDILTLSKIAL